jgi:hypothetical protein
VREQQGGEQQGWAAVRVVLCYVVCGWTANAAGLQLLGCHRVQKQFAEPLCLSCKCTAQQMWCLLSGCTGVATALICLAIAGGAALLGWGVACRVIHDQATPQEADMQNCMCHRVALLLLLLAAKLTSNAL